MITKVLSSRWIKFYFALSVAAFVLLEITTIRLEINLYNAVGIPLNILVAFILSLVLDNKYHLLDFIFKFRSKKYALISFPIAVYTVIEIALAFQKFRIDRIFAGEAENALGERIQSFLPTSLAWLLQYFFSALLGAFALFFVFCVVYAIVSRFSKHISQPLAKSIKDSDTIERWYVAVGFILLSILVIAMYCITEIFYMTHELMDIVFTLDSTGLIERDVFFTLYSPENDIRQPLFALLTMPFAVAAKFLARLFFFLPSPYILIMQLIQIAALLVMAVLILRMTGIKDKISKIAFLLMYSVTYPFLLYTFAVEQYIPATFILILAIYVYCYKKSGHAALLALSTGALLTNAAIVPFLTFKRKLRDWFHSIVKVVVFFIGTCIFCGKLPTLLDSLHIVSLVQSYGDIGAGERIDLSGKLYQFLHFIESCFLGPNTVIAENGNLMVFRLALPTDINLIGMLMFCIVATSIAINRKLLFAKICGLWTLFSIALLLIIGWGAPENGMMLYSLYISWAFFTLAFLLIEKLFAKLIAVKYTVFAVCFAIMCIANVGRIIELIRFGIEYYPVR